MDMLDYTEFTRSSNGALTCMSVYLAILIYRQNVTPPVGEGKSK